MLLFLIDNEQIEIKTTFDILLTNVYVDKNAKFLCVPCFATELRFRTLKFSIFDKRFKSTLNNAMQVVNHSNWQFFSEAEELSPIRSESKMTVKMSRRFLTV